MADVTKGGWVRLAFKASARTRPNASTARTGFQPDWAKTLMDPLPSVLD
jgi:hypothetical protein